MRTRTSFAHFFGDSNDSMDALTDRLHMDSIEGESASERDARFIRERHEAAQRIVVLETEAHALRGKLRNQD